MIGYRLVYQGWIPGRAGYQCFGRNALKVEAVRSFETFVSSCMTTRRYKPEQHQGDRRPELTQRRCQARWPRWLTAVAVGVSRGCSKEAAAAGGCDEVRPGLKPVAATGLSRSPPVPDPLLWNSATQEDYATRATPATGSVTCRVLWKSTVIDCRFGTGVISAVEDVT